MASITSLMNSNYNTNSIYGNRNVLSGLASGMDTETMIENAVSGIKMKIQNLIKKRTKVEWQQEAYRSIIDKAVNLNTKYTSYSSKTNLLSSSFFTNAVITTAKGTYADKITATGKTSSDIKINAVKQLATAASYTVSGLGGLFSGADGTITGKDFDVVGGKTVSAVSGSLSFQYGGANGTTFDISFDELENLTEVEVLNEDGSVKENATDAEKLAQAIRNKLSEISYTYTENGVSQATTADKAIQVNVKNGEITFSDGLGKGNSVKISSAIGDISKTLGISGGDTSIKMTSDTQLTKKVDSGADFLFNRTLGVTFNGTTKNIDLSNISDKIQSEIEKLNSEEGLSDEEKKARIEKINGTFKDLLQEELDKNFGTGKVEVSYGDGRLSFRALGEGDTLSLGGTAIEALGFESGDSNFINAGKTLKDLLGDRAGEFFNEKYRVEDKDGKAAYDFVINDAHISVTEDTTLESLMNSINSNPDAGVKVSYSKLTNEFKFTATETGSNSKIEFGGMAKAMFNPPSSFKSTDSFADAYGIDLGEGGSKRISIYDSHGNPLSFNITDETTIDDIIDELNVGGPFQPGVSDYAASYDEQTGKLVAVHRETGETFDLRITSENEAGETVEHEAQSNSTYTAGTDAIMDVTINGKQFADLTRSSNNFDIDGMSVTVKGTFSKSDVEEGKDYEPITFETVTDSDKIVDAIRSFVNDYNEMVTELKGAYSTQPGKQTDGSRYEPLTAEQEDGMTESEIKAYEEKAKQGILFGDTTLSSMYGKLLNAIAPGGVDGQTLREIGIGTSYENGLTTLSLNEDKLRAALDSDPDKVRTAFSKTKEGGASSDGLMQTLQNNLNTYVRTAGEPKGVLITRAGSIKAPTSLNNNSLNTQMNGIDREIDRWQNKMSSQIDRYTKQFSRLEQLVAAMNSQSAALASLMGGYEGY